MIGRTFVVATVVAVLGGFGAAGAQADTIRVQSTTDTVDAGLVDGLLKPAYAIAQPGDTLQYTAVGTGKAISNAQAGLADVVITHAPSLEAQFVAGGFSAEPFGRAIFYSDYVIVGPAGDPAHVLANHPHDAVGALEDIAAAGGAGTADFLSRGDNSGTNVQEQFMWGLTTTVVKEAAFNAGSDTTRFEPGAAGKIPAWYHRTAKGQAANVLETDACVAATYPSRACYTITDRGTFNNLVNGGTVTHLTVLSNLNRPSARGGQNLLINPFSAYIVSATAPIPSGSPMPNVAAATRFLDFLTSPGFQTAVDTFPSTTNPAFHADAYENVALAASLPPTALAGSTLTIDATMSSKLPGAAPLSGLPVQLQGTTDGGATYANLGAPVNTSSTGEVVLTVGIAKTTNFRLSFPRFQSLSPNTKDIGVVSVAAPSPAPTPAPVPPAPTPAKDKTPPRVTNVMLTARTLSLKLSKPGSVRASIARRIAKHGRHGGKVTTTFSYQTVRTFNFNLTKAGTVRGSAKKSLPGGTYRVTLNARDLAGNTSTRTVHPHLKAK